MTRTLEDGLNQAIATLGACGYVVNSYLRDDDGNPGIVVGCGDDVRCYGTTAGVLLSERHTDDWVTIVRTLESEARA